MSIEIRKPDVFNFFASLQAMLETSLPKSPEQQSRRLDRHHVSSSLTSLASTIGTALRHFKAPTAIVCGHSFIVWSMENGVSLRRTLSDVSIHGCQSLVVGTSVRATTLEDWAMIWTVKCFFHARGAMLVLQATFVDCARSIGLKIIVVDGPRV